MNQYEPINLSRAGTLEALSTGRILVGDGLITQAQLNIVLRQRDMYAAQGQTLFIDDLLIRNRFAGEKAIAESIEKHKGASKRGLSRSILPLDVCMRFGVLPVRAFNDVLELKACGPLSPGNLQTIIRACTVLVTELKLIPADRVEINEAHKQLSSGEYSFEQILSSMKSKEITGTVLRQAIQAMLVEAIEMRASDLRLDRMANPSAWISHRIDGVVHQSHLLDAKIMGAIFTRLKNECGMDASDQRRPQDGRLSISYKGRAIDFRVSTLPADGGESMSMRVLDADSVPSLETLFPNQPDMTSIFRKISQFKGKQGGIILFSGPTGSGKTTSLYSLTQMFPRDAINVMTVEDPIEFKLPFARQVQINSAMNQRMVDVERSMLRQDPDALMLGEIRDKDSLRASLRFAESGHMVLSTIHAKSDEETLGRILSMIGSEDKEDALYLLANTLRVIINQQLAPRLCSCTAPVENARETELLLEQATKVGLRLAEDTLLYRPVGCPKCRQTGYYKRVAAHETIIVPMDHRVRKNLAAILFDGMNAFSKISSLEGVIYKSRADTFSRLIEGGVTDVTAAVASLNQEFS